jgi:hypothetical protein
MAHLQAAGAGDGLQIREEGGWITANILNE